MCQGCKGWNENWISLDINGNYDSFFCTDFSLFFCTLRDKIHERQGD